MTRIHGLMKRLLPMFFSVLLVAGCGGGGGDEAASYIVTPLAGANGGISVALASDGSTLAVGAAFESSNATGIDGDQADDSAEFSAAVYLY